MADTPPGEQKSEPDNARRRGLMVERPRRLLAVTTHAIQYMGPLYRVMASDPRLDLLVAFCSLQGAQAGLDPEFGISVKWDVPILSGYRWVHVPNRSPFPGLGKFFGLINPGLWRLIRDGEFDAVLVCGYANVSYWLAILAARASGTPLILGTDATSLASRDARRWKTPIKRVVLPAIFGLANAAVGSSTPGVRFLRSLRIGPDRALLTRYAVDNDTFAAAAARADSAVTRSGWGVPPDAKVVLFCGKLQPWKRADDLIRAFATANVPSAYLVIVGEGPLRSELEGLARTLGVESRVRFVGFMNQAAMPEIYHASDVLAVPSGHEPWGLVVNEAMACGRPVIVSDRVGAREDLIIEGETGYSYKAGDVAALARHLERTLNDPQSLRELGAAAKQRIDRWSYREHIDGVVAAVDAAVRNGPRRRP